jgi:hypothetical protein
MKRKLLNVSIEDQQMDKQPKIELSKQLRYRVGEQQSKDEVKEQKSRDDHR